MRIDSEAWRSSGIPFHVQEDGFIFGEFHREEYAKIFANALIKDGKAGSHLSIWGPDGWVEYEDDE